MVRVSAPCTVIGRATSSRRRRPGGKVDENQDAVGKGVERVGDRDDSVGFSRRRGDGWNGSYRTWQGRLPQELRVHQITTVEEANRWSFDMATPLEIRSVKSALVC